MQHSAPATNEAYTLAEGPVWDGPRDRLLWVDIMQGAILEGRLREDHRIDVTGRTELGEMVGAVAVATDGALLVAAQQRLLRLGVDGTRVDGPRVLPAGQRRRLNDGATDPTGRFLVGTLSLAGSSNGVTGRETLVRLEDDGALTLLDDDLTLSNGLAWSTDGTRMYSVDTLSNRVFVRPYDPATGAVGHRRVHLEVVGGHPDGIAMDAKDHLWMAVWGAGEVRCHAPDGSLVGGVATGAPHTSSVAFAGRDLRTLVITTARDGLSDPQLADHPDSGRLFTTRVDVPGAPVPPWNGAGVS